MYFPTHIVFFMLATALLPIFATAAPAIVHPHELDARAPSTNATATIDAPVTTSTIELGARICRKDCIRKGASSTSTTAIAV